MRPRLKKLLITLAAVAVLITAFVLVSPYSPLPYYTANPKDYAECMDDAHGVHDNSQGINSCIFRDKVFIEHVPKNDSLKQN